MNHTPKTVSARDIVFDDEALNIPPMAEPVSIGPIDMDAVLHDIWRRLQEAGNSNHNQRL